MKDIPMTNADHTFYSAFAVMIAVGAALVWDAFRYSGRHRKDDK